MLQNKLFCCLNKDTYPPFKNGFYLEEYFFNYSYEKNPKYKRKYIPVIWTNFQIEPWFNNKKEEMQEILNNWVSENPCEHGYFTVVQYDDGPLLKLPINTIVYGACSGDIPIPLIYQDINNTLVNYLKKTFTEKEILCSFVGSITSNHIEPNVRKVIVNEFKNNSKFNIFCTSEWSPNVNKTLQDIFINNTINSKYALAPRGYGRGSFRFFECLQLGTIPIYIWNDIEWLPFKNIIDYDKLCISLHISRITELELILKNITEDDYNKMFEYYNSIKYLFELEGMTKKIIEDNL